MRLRTALPLLLGSASVMLCGLGIGLAQPPERPQVRVPQATPAPSAPAGKLRPFRTGVEDSSGRRTPPGALVDFTLEDADLPDLVRLISQVTGKRFILPGKARSIKATVASTRPVTAAEAYRAFLSILELNGMTIVPVGRYLKIIETAGSENQPLPVVVDGEAMPADDRYLTRLHRVENVSAEDVATLLGRFKSREGNVTAYAPTNTIILTDTGRNIRRMLRILQEIDVPRTGEQIWIEPIHYANAEELSSRLSEIFPSAGGGGGGGSAAAQPSNRARAAQQRAAARRRAASKAGGDNQPATVGSRAGESRITNIIPDERTNSLILVATERAYLRILEVVRALDVPVEGEGSVHVHRLQYADAELMAQTLQSLIGGGGPAAGSRRTKAPTKAAATAGGAGSFEGDITVQAHKSTNSLLITSSFHDYASLRGVLRQLDVAPRQVFLEAVIMELSVSRNTELGLAYHGGVPVPSTDEGDSVTLFGFEAARTATPPSAEALAPLATGLAVGVRGPLLEQASQLFGVSLPSFGVLLQALATSGDVDVLSTPHLIAMDNVEAEITVGQNVPLQTSGLFGVGQNAAALGGAASQLQQGQAAGLAGIAGLGGFGGGNVQRQDVGTTIRVTPHINDAGEIRMELEMEDSEAGEPQGNLGVVPISQRIAKTQVLTRDQQTVVIGGLMRDRVANQETKIPILGDIPLLGVLFRTQSTSSQKRNLLLFLTPYIIRSPEDMRSVYERRLRERQDFIDRYFVFSDRSYRTAIDYTRTRGLLSEILNTLEELEEEERLAEELRAQPPPEHVPRPPIGASPIDDAASEGGDAVIISPEDDEEIATESPAEPDLAVDEQE